MTGRLFQAAGVGEGEAERRAGAEESAGVKVTAEGGGVKVAAEGAGVKLPAAAGLGVRAEGAGVKVPAEGAGVKMPADTPVAVGKGVGVSTAGACGVTVEGDCSTGAEQAARSSSTGNQ